ncbi:hypothetical protein [Nocardia amamiensis]
MLILGAADPGSAWSRLEQARDVSIPDTAQQREWEFEPAEHRDSPAR